MNQWWLFMKSKSNQRHTITTTYGGLINLQRAITSDDIHKHKDDIEAKAGEASKISELERDIPWRHCCSQRCIRLYAESR